VAFGVALLAMYLYRSGSGGAIGRSGAVRVTAVTIVTLLLAFFAGVVSDVLEVWTLDTGEGATTALLSSDFWPGFGYVMGLDGAVSSYGKDAGLALLLGALGCFSTLRGRSAPRTCRARRPAAHRTPTARTRPRALRLLSAATRSTSAAAVALPPLAPSPPAPPPPVRPTTGFRRSGRRAPSPTTRTSDRRHR